MRCVRPDEKRAKGFPSRVPPVERGAPQHPCLKAHLRFVSAWQVQWLGRWEVPRPVRPVSAPASNPMLMAETTEELRKRPEIRKELERATGEKRREEIQPPESDRFWFVAYAVALAICAAFYFLVSAKVIPLPQAGLG